MGGRLFADIVQPLAELGSDKRHERRTRPGRRREKIKAWQARPGRDRRRGWEYTAVRSIDKERHREKPRGRVSDFNKKPAYGGQAAWSWGISGRIFDVVQPGQPVK